ncbi:MAG TPA: MlaD family protein [Bryobacteraceae bacterium]|jgi:phospholipid/cholesterol/gamma-HCH transport system substrate-binding protein|nr:MlaD family protein [Bryobacteraceae bacterium]
MPVQTKASWARLKVGVLALFAMAILALLIFLITGNTNIFESQATIYTYMADAAALTDGAPVNLDGIPIGKVKAIRLSGAKDPMRLVRIEMEIPEGQLKNIPSDSLASISAANVLGTKYINLKTGKGTTPIGPGQELPSLNSGEFQDLVQQGFSVLTSLQDTVQRVDRIVGLVESGKGSIGKLLVDETLYNNLLQILAQVRGLADTLNSDKGTIGALLNNRELYDNFRATLGRVDTMLQDLQNGQGTAGKLLKDDAVYNETRETIAGVHKLVDDLNAGKGTAGQLLKSDDLSNQLKGTLTTLDSILDKVNSGQGTIGQLLVNQQMYDNLNGATREMHLLMKDFRANPKKFLRIKLAIF